MITAMMKTFTKTTLCAGAAAVMLTALATPAQTAGLDAAQRSEIEALVHDYILEHPEVIIEAARKYQAQQEAMEKAKQADALKGAEQYFRSSKDHPRLGNPEGDVQFVEFFDYQCGYCKRVFPTVMDILDTDKKLDVVMVEFLVLGPVSEYAARAALASQKQGKYFEYHVALMEARGQLSVERVMEIADDVGLDLDQLKEDMKSEQINAHLRQNHEIAQSLGIRGTPAFVIGSELAPGAIEKDRMLDMIGNARKGS